MCLICERILQIRQGTNPYFVKELQTGYIVLGDHQHFKGYTLFLCKEHKSELFHLEPKQKTLFLEEMSVAAQAVSQAFGAEKMNCELLGNGDAHLHWHLFPRISGGSGGIRQPGERAGVVVSQGKHVRRQHTAFPGMPSANESQTIAGTGDVDSEPGKIKNQRVIRWFLLYSYAFPSQPRTLVILWATISWIAVRAGPRYCRGSKWEGFSARYLRTVPVIARRKSESMLILHTAIWAALRSMSSGDTDRVGHLAAVFVDHPDKLRDDRRSPVQNDREARQPVGDLFQNIEAELRLLAPV